MSALLLYTVTNRNTSGFSHFIQRHSTCFERLIVRSSIKTHGDDVERESNPVPLPDLYFDSFSYPVASIVFGDMAIVSLFLLFFFLANPRSCLEGYRLAQRIACMCRA